jgi:hypothetical protein
VLRMIYTSRPHLEKMTLFWHNHLTSNASTVANQNYMGMQNDFFRRNAHGSFLDILRGITRDAAMLRYLDNDSNIVTRTGRDGVTYWEGSNENYGRELLELYGLGISSGYTEDDVKACARALTGWGLDFGNGTTRFRFRYNEHVSAKFLPPDALPGFPGQGPSGQAPFRFLGEDRVWGQITTPAEAGNANGDWFGTYPYDTSWKNPQFDPHQKIVDWTGYDGGTQPKAGIHIARKLWLFFGGPLSALSQSDLDAMVEAYRGQGPYTSGQYGIKGMLKTLFMSTSFRSDTAYRSLVKSPVEFLVGVLRGLQAPGTFGGSAFSTPTETGNTAADLRNMDQDLLNPPFPSGWDGFDSWINSTTWMARLNVLNSILNRRTTPSSVTPTTVSDFFNANAYIAQYGLTSWQSTIDHLLDTFLDIRPGSPAPSDVPAPAPAAIHAGGSTSIAMPVLYRGSGLSAVNEYETWSARLNAYVQSVPWTATPDTTGTNAQPSAQAKFRGLVYLVLGSPEFQLA